MSAETLPTIGQSIVDDIEAFSFNTALARLADPEDGGALSPVLAGLLRTRAQIGLEKWRTAYDTLQQVKGMPDLGTAERLEAQVQTARVLRIGWWSTDYALDLALAAAQQATRTNAISLAVDAHLEAAILFGRKRCRDLSRKQLAAAAEIGAHAARVHATTGDLSITFDERPAAKDSFTAAIERAAAEAEARARGE